MNMKCALYCGDFDVDLQDITDAKKGCCLCSIVHGMAGVTNKRHAAILARPWESNLCPHFLFLVFQREIPANNNYSYYVLMLELK